MDMNEVRRANLRRLIDEKFSGRDADFARHCGLDPARLSQVLSKTYRGGKTFGEKAARNIEQQAGLPTMFLDSMDAPPATTALDSLSDALARSQPLDNLTVGELVELLGLYAKVPADRRETILHMIRIAADAARLIDNKTKQR